MKRVRQGRNAFVPALPDSFPLKPQFAAGWQYVPEFLALQRLPRCIFFIYRRKDKLTKILSESVETERKMKFL